MDSSVLLVEQALAYLKRHDLDSYLSLLSPDVQIGINDDLPERFSPDKLRLLLGGEQVLKYRVDGVVLGQSVQVVVQVLHRHHIVGKGWVRSVYWVRAGKIERIQLGKLFVPGRAWISRPRFWPF